MLMKIFPIFGAVNPGLGAVPLIVILIITAFKDAMEDWRRTILDNELNNTRTKTLHDWHNANVVEEQISLWRRIKKATSRFIRLMGARRKGIKQDPHELDRTSTIIRLSESSVRHPDAYPLGTVDSRTNGFYTAPSSPTTADAPSFQKRPNNGSSVLDPYLSTPQKAKFRTTFWKNVRVGDFILLRSDDPIPADIVVLATSDSDGACYVETKNLDGETNLKVRHALRCGSDIKSAYDCEAASFWIESEGPGPNLYSYNGVAKWYSRDVNNPNADPEIKAEPISIENLLLRGCNLKNTDWVIGAVVFTGEETRIMMNSGTTPSKRSRIAKSLNWNVFVHLKKLTVGYR
jgi:phospholipid-translocating ATPase